MNIEKVTVYRTTDDKEFTALSLARRHQREIDTENALAVLLDTAVRTQRVDSVLRALVVHAPEIREVLNGYLRRQPKGKTLAALAA